MTAKTALEVTTPSDREVAMIRSFDAPRRLVWEAWTTPRYVQQWLLGPEGWSMPVCEIDLRVGGRWHFVWRRPGAKDMAMSGVYREIAPPDRLVFTERWGPEWPETVNTVALLEKAGRTTVTMTLQYPDKAARDAALATGMADGVAPSFDRLAAVVRSMR